ncbi:MAG: glycine C-acetyltransferase [Bdellovibrionota bacterium]|nr:glycine C-acetyltransferase [Bdellovibrionota bacterium]MEC8623957.1 glycine C-acetyltransferase [Bdellovibrionota bacterium]
MTKDIFTHLKNELEAIKNAGLYKEERVITSAQNSKIQSGGKEVVNLCSNNYLGLSNHPNLISEAKKSLEDYGFGMSSVRFICGTQNIHTLLEEKISSFLEMEDTILYSSCFDANAGLFETLLGSEDAIISDSLNHASIIDGIRLCKAKRLRYKNNNLEDLESKLREAEGCRFKMIATDGVFSMDGLIANLKGICDLAEKYNALVMVDDSHAVGFLGEAGKGSPEFCNVMGRVDIITGTLGKALGGASGGYVSGKKEIIDFLRQRSRPYLFSNTLAPVITATSIKVIEMLQETGELRKKLKDNSAFFRREMEAAGFKLLPGEHPIIPIMLGDAELAKNMADELLNEGIYVVGFSYPVVPKGLARIRTQISAAHSKQDLERAVKAFVKIGKKLGVV